MNPRTRRPRGGLSERAINSVPLSALTPLSRRQAGVLGWIAAGKRNGETATILTISGRTAWILAFNRDLVALEIRNS